MTSINVNRLDGLSSATAWKGPVRVATTTNIQLSDLQIIDGVALNDGDRVLVKDQTDARYNGIWVADTGLWRRARDFASNRDVREGTQVFVVEGVTYNRSGWYVSSDDPIQFGTTDIHFTQNMLINSGQLEELVEQAQEAADEAEQARIAAELAAAAAEAAAAMANGITPVPTRSVLKLLNYTEKKAALIYDEGGRNGLFAFVPGDLSSRVAADVQEGIYVAPANAPSGIDGAWERIVEASYDPCWFGAVLGNTNDYATINRVAFQACIDFANFTRSAPVILPAGTIVVSSTINIPKSYNVIIDGYGILSRIRGGNGFTGNVFNYGDNTVGGGIASRIRNITILGPLSGTSTGIGATDANATSFEGLRFEDQQTAISLTNCFAVLVKGCHFTRTALHNIYSATSAHNLLLKDNRMYGCQNAVVRIDAQTSNIVFEGNDIENCGSIFLTPSGVDIVAFRFVGNYTEGNVNQEFTFQGMCYGFTCEDNVIGLRGATPGSPTGSGEVSTYNNIRGGSFKNNDQYEQKVAWGTNVSGVTVTRGRLIGNSSLSQPPLKVPSLSNTWTATDTTTFPVGYIRDGGGKVSIRGRLTSGASSSGNVAFTLPDGYRPSQRLLFTIHSSAGGTQCTIDTNGNVLPIAASSVNVWLDGISFNAVDA
nr:right-handed parallel beta-helix repeat-containing protein [Ochrobactrum sp. UNC390CL2Tsu3S39]